MNLNSPGGFIGRGRGKTGWNRPQNWLYHGTAGMAKHGTK